MPMFVFNYIHHIKSASPLHNLIRFIRIHPFSSSSSSNGTSFAVDYLINSCGLTLERAVVASKHVNFKVADKPNSVLAFFKDQGFTHAQISKLITSSPSLLKCHPQKNFLPKLEFIKSKGISGSEVVEIVSKSPVILTRSLEKCLIPTFDFFSDFIKSKEKANGAFKRFLGFPLFRLEIYMKPNIEMLKQAGVPVKNIRYLVTHHFKVLLTRCDEYRRIVEEVKEMGFHPVKMSFLVAVMALTSMKKSTWNRKIEVYKRWGWTENDIVGAFRKAPWCMTISEDKINSVMEFLVGNMYLKSSVLADRPHIFSLSLGKRIVPRVVVYQALVAKGLLKPGDTGLTTLIQYSEKRFLERITSRHEDEAPDLLKLYQQKLDFAK